MRSCSKTILLKNLIYFLLTIENEEELAYKPVMDFRHFRDFLEEAAADEMSNPYNKGPEVKSKGTKPGKKSKMRGICISSFRIFFKVGTLL